MPISLQVYPCPAALFMSNAGLANMNLLLSHKLWQDFRITTKGVQVYLPPYFKPNDLQTLLEKYNNAYNFWHQHAAVSFNQQVYNLFAKRSNTKQPGLRHNYSYLYLNGASCLGACCLA